jgi:hypothetical protein
MQLWPRILQITCPLTCHLYCLLHPPVLQLWPWILQITDPLTCHLYCLLHPSVLQLWPRILQICAMEEQAQFRTVAKGGTAAVQVWG